MGGKTAVTRSTVDLNEALLEVVLGQLGSRVGVELIYFHLDALYKIMQVTVDRPMAVSSARVSITRDVWFPQLLQHALGNLC